MASKNAQNSLITTTALKTNHKSIGTTLTMPKIYSNILKIT